MKVLLVNKFHYMRGGSETYYFGLADLLREKGHEVVCFSMKDDKNLPCEQAKWFVENVDYNGQNGALRKLKMAKDMIWSGDAKARFEQLVLAEKPDVVHIGLVHRQITLSILEVTRKYNIPVVFIVHDLIWICPCYTMLSRGSFCDDCVSGHYASCVKKKCVKGSTAKSLLAVAEAKFIRSKGYADHIDLYIAQCARYKGLMEGAGFTKAPIVHMVNFLPKEKTYEQHAPAGQPYYLYFGRFSQEKGILTLMKAYLASGVKEPLWIVGAGPEKERIEAFWKESGCPESIRLVGPTYGAEMEQILRGCKAVVVPSEWEENCPYAMMEAMAKGVPVVAARVGGLPELIRDGVSGRLFTAANVQELAACLRDISALDADAYHAMCEAVLADAREKFDRDRYADRLLELYNKLIAEKGAPNYG